MRKHVFIVYVYTLFQFVKNAQDWIIFIRTLVAWISDKLMNINTDSIMISHSATVFIDVCTIYLFYILERSIKVHIRRQDLLNKFQAFKIEKIGIGAFGASPENYLYYLKNKFTKKEIIELVDLGAIPYDYESNDKFNESH